MQIHPFSQGLLCQFRLKWWMQFRIRVLYVLRRRQNAQKGLDYSLVLHLALDNNIMSYSSDKKKHITGIVTTYMATVWNSRWWRFSCVRHSTRPILLT